MDSLKTLQSERNLAHVKKKSRARQRAQATKLIFQATHGENFTRLREWLLPSSDIFAHLSLHGNTKWQPLNLIWLALLWAWSDQRNLTDAFASALEQSRALLPGVAVSTYQGLMNALVKWTSKLIPLLCQVLQRCMQQLGRHWRTGGWLLLAMDGFRSDAPRTRSNEAAFCAKNYGKGKRAKYGKKKSKGMRRKRNQENPPHPQGPQVWVTMIWHMALRLPWLWRSGPSNSSERHQAMAMIERGKYPENTLFCADAGFVGFPLWSHLLQAGCDFLVRVGANVSLLSEHTKYHFEKVGSEGIVLCWPRAARKSAQAPLRLRLMRIRLGKTEMWLLTSVLEPTRLTLEQAEPFYRMRWGVEVEIRGLKQTLDRAKLRCRDSHRLRAELDWSILAMAVAELFALKEQLAVKQVKRQGKKQKSDPAHRSLAQTMRALRECLRLPNEVPVPGRDLSTLLREAVTDDYVRQADKRARYRPKNPDKKPLGNPKLQRIARTVQKELNAFEAANAA